MQELAPELKKLKEKYKDDPQALTQAQMELYRKHGVNPLGHAAGCCCLQMPIFLGLYYALQESIHFRLAPFSAGSTNLAAPDMLFWWGERIPLISRPDGLRRLALPGAVLQPAADHRGGADDRAAEDDDAAADGRAAGDAAEDDEVHDDLHRPDVLQGGGGAVHLLHRQQPVGSGRAEAAAEDEGATARRARRGARTTKHRRRKAGAGRSARGPRPSAAATATAPVQKVRDWWDEGAPKEATKK